MGLCCSNCNKRPQIWPQIFPIASEGKRQSPIDINTSKCVTKSGTIEESALKIIYPNVFPELSIQNSGHGWKVEIPEELAITTSLSGGPLQHNYRLTQFHCHWGKDCNVGSEHTVDGKSYAAELHFVHWNSQLFANPLDALPNDNGLAVLGVFLEVGAQRNEELDNIMKNICLVKYKGDSCKLVQNLDIMKLLPENKSHWSYLGSLTTPPLCESVTWIVFSNPIHCTADQIATFRELYNVCREESPFGGQLVENFRTTQPLNERTVTFYSV